MLATNSLTTLATVRDELRLPDDSLDDTLTRYINAATDAIERHCDRSFYFQSSRIDKLKGQGTQFLVATKTPIITIVTLTVDVPVIEGPLVEGDGFVLQDQGTDGIIFREAGWPWRTAIAGPITNDPANGEERDNITLTYDCGYVTPKQVDDDQALPVPLNIVRTLPYDLEDACVQTVVARYFAKGQDQRVKSEKLLSGSVTYRDNAEGSGGLPSAVVAILEPYCNSVFA